MEYPSLDTPTAGAFRYNTDNNQLEIYDGNQWTGVLSSDSQLHWLEGTRGIQWNASPFAITYFNIATAGINAADFGDMNPNKSSSGATGDRTRCLSCGGQDTPASNYINNVQYVTFTSTGNATDFGDMLNPYRGWGARGSNSTRAVLYGGNNNSSPGYTNVIEYITVQSTGNAVDFGDRTLNGGVSCCSSTTRIVGGGQYESPGRTNTVDYVITATTGNAMDFGDLTAARNDAQAVSNATRGLFGGGGQDAPANDQTNIIDYITMATLGNAVDFGDLSYARQSHSAASSTTRGVWTNGYRYSPAGHITNMDYVQLASHGNATDFGDAAHAVGNTANSNGRGGL